MLSNFLGMKELLDYAREHQTKRVFLYRLRKSMAGKSITGPAK